MTGMYFLWCILGNQKEKTGGCCDTQINTPVFSQVWPWSYTGDFFKINICSHVIKTGFKYVVNCYVKATEGI